MTPADLLYKHLSVRTFASVKVPSASRVPDAAVARARTHAHTHSDLLTLHFMVVTREAQSGHGHHGERVLV